MRKYNVIIFYITESYCIVFEVNLCNVCVFLLQAFILQKHLYENRLDDSDLESSDWKNCTGRALLINDSI